MIGAAAMPEHPTTAHDPISALVAQAEGWLQAGDLDQAGAALIDAGILSLQGSDREQARHLWQIALSLRGEVDLRAWVEHLVTIQDRLPHELLEPFLLETIDIPTDDIALLQFQAQIAYTRGRLDRAETLFRHAFQAGATNPKYLFPFATLLVHAEKYREALTIFPYLDGTEYEAPAAPWRGVAIMQCGAATQQAINDPVRQWGHAHFHPRPHLPVPQPMHPLRIGICSYWLGHSPILTSLLGALVPALIRQGCDIILYPLGPHDPANIPHMPGCRWTSLHGLDGRDAAAVTRMDQLHALITLDIVAMSPVVAFYQARPAPLVISHMHCVLTHGGAADGLIADAWMMPHALMASFDEDILLTPECAIFLPPNPAAPPLTTPPSQRNGFITFGSFNRPCKIGPETTQAWAQLLARVPGSRLFLRSKYFDAAETARITGLLVADGLAANRIDIEGPTSPADFLASYDRIDIALDPIHFSGGLTTIEALWQGVPLIAEPGDTVASRMSASILAAIGREEWIADSRQDWLARSIALIQDPEALARWRRDLRQDVASSVICDADRTATNLLAAISPWIARRA